MNHAWTILCRRTLTDANTNTLSIIDTVELIEFETNEEINALPIELEIVSLWWRTNPEEPENGKGRTQIVYPPTNESLINIPYDIDLTKASRHRLLGKFVGIPFAGSGIYEIVIQILDETANIWQTVATLPLEIKRKKTS